MWQNIPLGELCTKIGSGATPRGGSKSYKRSGIALVRSMNVHTGKFEPRGLAHIDAAQATRLKNAMLERNDVLLNITGASVARCCVLRNSILPGRVNQHVCILRPLPERLHYGYLMRFLTAETTQRALLGIAGSGATREAITKSEIERFHVPLPPLTEQKRIAAILDAADALRAKRRESIAQLDTLLQSVFLDMFGDPVTNPRRLRTVRFSEIGCFVSGATPSKRRADFWNGSVPWVSPKDMKVRNLFDSQDHVTELAFDETNLKRLLPGHVLIVVRGMILAHSFPVALNEVPVAINQDMKGIRPSAEFNTEFLAECIRRMERQIVDEVSTAAHGTKRFDAKAMTKILVPVPSFARQQEFSRIVACIESQKQSQQAHLAELDTLFASLQSRAFRGEL